MTSRFRARLRSLTVCLGLIVAMPSYGQVFMPIAPPPFNPVGNPFAFLDNWLSPQNSLLAELVAQHMTEIAHLTSIISNTANVVSAANDGFAFVRRAHGTYQMLRRYDAEQLANDALAGMRRGFPELGRLEHELRLAIANGEAVSNGSDPFFSRIDYHDVNVGVALRANFAHAYQAAIYPMVFPESMNFKPNPTPAELLVQSRYRRTEDMARFALQNTAFQVIADKVKAIVEDAEQKDNADLRAGALNTQINLQNLENGTQMRNLREQEIAEEEANLARAADFQKNTGNFIKSFGHTLMTAE